MAQHGRLLDDPEAAQLGSTLRDVFADLDHVVNVRLRVGASRDRQTHQIHRRGLLGIAPRWGAAGITVASGVAAWLELRLLRSALRSRLGIDHRLTSVVLKLWVCAALAAGAGWGVKLLLGEAHPWVLAALVLGTFALVYLAATVAAGIEEARALLVRVSHQAAAAPAPAHTAEILIGGRT